MDVSLDFLNITSFETGSAADLHRATRLSCTSGVRAGPR